MFSSFVQITALQQQFVIFSASTIAPGNIAPLIKMYNKGKNIRV